MTTDGIRAAYARLLQEHFAIRRYTGSGTNRPFMDYPVRGSVSGYAPHELIGTVQQGDQKVIISYDDLIAAQLALPVTASDKVIVNGRELAIITPKPRCALDGTNIAYELQARG